MLGVSAVDTAGDLSRDEGIEVRHNGKAVNREGLQVPGRNILDAPLRFLPWGC